MAHNQQSLNIWAKQKKKKKCPEQVFAPPVKLNDNFITQHLFCLLCSEFFWYTCSLD